MLDKLLKLKAEAEHDLLYATATIEVVDKLMAEITAKEEKPEEVVEDFQVEDEDATI